MKQVAVITGASSGMGREFVKQLLEGTSSLDEYWLIARRKEVLLEIAAKYPDKKIWILSLDLEQEESWKEYKKKLEKYTPSIALLINAAGYGKIGSCSEIPWWEQTGMIRLNCEALTAITQLTIPYMKKGGRIIEVASASAFVPQPGFNVYAASKAYVLSYSRALNRELKKKHISVTAVCPGPVETEFFQRAEERKKTPAYKKLFRASKERVVKKALKDADRRREVSVYGGSIKAMRAAVKVVPHRLILKGFRSS